jgi:hypothetical protein
MSTINKLIADLEAIPLADMTEQDQRTFAAAIGQLRRLSDRVHMLEISQHRANEIKAAATSLEESVAEFLDAYTAFNNDQLDEVSMNDAEHDMKLSMYAFREVRSDIPESIKINISKGQLMARAAMADAPRRNAMRETLEWIERHYANQDMSHVDFRVEAYTRTREALEQSQ